ncbi:hypothetical protein ACHQM5_024549 [Ranunculus cassubicifolius]
MWKNPTTMAISKPLKIMFSISSPSSSSQMLKSAIRCFSSSKTLLFSSPQFKPKPSLNNFIKFRTICSVYSPNRYELNDHRDNEDYMETAPKTTIPVRAYFISTSVNLRSLTEQNKPNFIPPTSRMTNYVVLRFSNPKCNLTSLEGSLSVRDCSYMVVFQYGSIVLFNIRDHEVDGFLKIVETHASRLLPEMRKDVDGMVAEFTDINREMEKTGTSTMKRKKLFQLVGKANSNLADVILKLGLFERSDIAWKDAKYAQIWEYLRDEFELTQRFASLDFKLRSLIFWNGLLIGAEIIISVYGLAREVA